MPVGCTGSERAIQTPPPNGRGRCHNRRSTSGNRKEALPWYDEVPWTGAFRLVTEQSRPGRAMSAGRRNCIRAARRHRAGQGARSGEIRPGSAFPRRGVSAPRPDRLIPRGLPPQFSATQGGLPVFRELGIYRPSGYPPEPFCAQRDVLNRSPRGPQNRPGDGRRRGRSPGPSRPLRCGRSSGTPRP